MTEQPFLLERDLGWPQKGQTPVQGSWGLEVGAGLDSEEKWGSLSLHPTLHPSVPTFLLYTPSPANLLHPEWLQDWDSGVLLLHGYRLLVCRPVERGAPLSPQASYLQLCQPSFHFSRGQTLLSDFLYTSVFKTRVLCFSNVTL